MTQEPTTRLAQVIISPDTSISSALVQLQQAATGILLICDAEHTLLAVLTNGDIRRALMNEISLDQPCIQIANPKPLVAPADISPTDALQLMDYGRGMPDEHVNALPLVDTQSRAVGLLLRSDLSIADDRQERLEKTIIPPDMEIAATLPHLDAAGTGILLVCDAQRHLLGVLTDGDIRRAILNGVNLGAPCSSIAVADPITAPPDISPEAALHLLDHGCSFQMNQLPLVDAAGQVVGLLLRSDLVTTNQPALSAMIMAGGFGMRLHPLTVETPKPMLPIGDRPLLERTISRLSQIGIHRVHITTHYKPEKITSYFGDGQQFGVSMSYVNESEPLGTAGGLALMDTFDEPMLVINGDILTGVDFRAMRDFHHEHGAAVTVGVRVHEIQVPYGVLETTGPYVQALREKPRYSFLINAGIYLVEPSVRRLIPRNTRFDMTDLIEVLIREEQTVVSFPILEYWLDIGQHADYQRAQEDVKLGKI
jgi:dTDP-glucose pyrophosphorylase/CBS domain-containing protein